jgi:hypothetical protein
MGEGEEPAARAGCDGEGGGIAIEKGFEDGDGDGDVDGWMAGWLGRDGMMREKKISVWMALIAPPFPRWYARISGAAAAAARAAELQGLESCGVARGLMSDKS